MHLIPSLISLQFTVAFHTLSKGRTCPVSLLINVQVYIVLGLQMHCYGPNRDVCSFAPTFLCLAWGTPKPLQLSMDPKVDAEQGLSGSPLAQSDSMVHNTLRPCGSQLLRTAPTYSNKIMLFFHSNSNTLLQLSKSHLSLQLLLWKKPLHKQHTSIRYP